MSDSLSGYQENNTNLRQAYMHFMLENGRRPASVYKFMKEMDKQESEFYQHYNSFNALEKAIWKGFFDETVERLRQEERFREYSVREKVLAFYFTWIEVLKQNRSFVLFTADRIRNMDIRPDFLNYFKEDFLKFMEDLLEEGYQTGEVLDRPLVSRKYADGLWVQTLLILKFWLDDESPGFEETDAFIEKTVALSFELMGRGAVDTFLDLAKFLYHKKK